MRNRLVLLHGLVPVMVALVSVVVSLMACNTHPQAVNYVGVYSDGSLFIDSLFGIIDSTERYWIDTERAGAACILLETQQDFNGDGQTDALITHVQACGGNAVGNAFFFVSYIGDGKFALSNSFGTNVYDDPRIETWEGMKAVVITESSFDEWTEEYESHDERYVLIDSFAVRAVSPKSVTPMPTISLEEWAKTDDMEDVGEEVVMSQEDSIKYAGCDIFDDLYSGHCSWYCGGEVQEITTSSCRVDADSTFDSSHAHDFNHEKVWSPEGEGIGESLVYHFAGACPRITTVKILNGDVKSDEAWQASSRAKMIKMYVNDKPYALLALEDSRSRQCFDVGIVGFHDMKAPDWTLRFEVMDVYPGAKNRSLVISELYFDGIDVH